MENFWMFENLDFGDCSAEDIRDVVQTESPMKKISDSVTLNLTACDGKLTFLSVTPLIYILYIESNVACSGGSPSLT